MQSLSWRNIRSLLAAGLIGLSGTTAQALDGRPTRLSSLDQVFSLNGQAIVLGQSCNTAAACDGADGGDYGASCDDCDCVGDWRDNTEIWFGGDAYKSLGDAGLTGFNPLPFPIANSFGLVGGFNTGLAIGESRVRAQVGGSFGAYDFKGRLLPPKNDSLEQQSYTTLGLYKRSDIGDDDPICWGLVYDAFLGHQWGWAGNEVFLSQIRYRGGYAINECNELGAWGTLQVHDDDSVAFGFPIGTQLTTVHAMNQLNSYWNHHWAFGGTSMGYVGLVDKADIASWQFGLLNLAPVNHNVSVYANFTYVAPSSATGVVGAAEEQWNVSAGLTYYFGGKASSSTVSGNRGLPLMPVANNGSFLITN